MKLLKVTTESRAYTEEEAKECIENFRTEAAANNYLVGAVGYTRKQKIKKGEVISEGFLIKTTALYNDFWESADNE